MIKLLPCPRCGQLPSHSKDIYGHTMAHICNGNYGYGGVFNRTTKARAARAWNRQQEKKGRQ